jgi:hypothetical protein
MRTVIQIDDDARIDFVQELDVIAATLDSKVGTEADRLTTVESGLATLCRLGADILRPRPSGPPPTDGEQLSLFPDAEG